MPKKKILKKKGKAISCISCLVGKVTLPVLSLRWSLEEWLWLSTLGTVVIGRDALCGQPTFFQVPGPHWCVGGLSKLSPLCKYQLSPKLWVCCLQAELRWAFWYKCCLGGRPWAGGGLGGEGRGEAKKRCVFSWSPPSASPHRCSETRMSAQNSPSLKQGRSSLLLKWDE